jgi:hypothetical protein
MSRPSMVLRDAALGYASRGIPVLPLHYPFPRRGALQPIPGAQPPAVGTGCSCRDPGCGQPGKHPLGSLVPHGVKDATCNRARVVAWWTRHPQANIGLACGYAFDVLDVGGPAGAQALRALAAEHGLQSSGPLVRTGGGGWHFYLAPTGLGNVRPAGLEHVDWRGRGGYVVAPPSRHASGHPYQWATGRDLDTPPGTVPAVLLERLDRRPPQRPAGPVELTAVGDGPGGRYARAALAEELARVVTAPMGQRNRQLWESTRNLYNLVASGALDHREVHQGLLATAERCGLLADEPRQTRRTLASGRQVGLAHPAAHDSPPAPTAPIPRRSRPCRQPASGTKGGGEGHGRRRPPGRLTVFQGVGACRRQAEPAPTHHPAGRSSWMGSPPTLDPAPTRPPDTDRHHPDDGVDLLAHLQTPAALGGHEFQEWPVDQIAGGFGGDLHARHRHDHTRLTTEFTHTHPNLERDAVRDAEQAFDRLNPDYGVPADQRSHYGRQAVRQREAALALGVRVAVHDSRQNDRNPVIWQAGQDYRVADAIHTARHHPTQVRWGPERVGPER